MGLIKCPDCEREVSDRAPSCPNCGAPIAAAEPVLTTQQTAKRFKGAEAIGAVVLMIGIVLLFLPGAESGTLGVGVLLSTVGIIVTLSAKIGAWWHHG